MKPIRSFFVCAIALAFTCNVSSAAIVFSSNLDDLTGFTVLGTADSNHVPSYDYSADGIPEAPNSLGGAATTGLKLEANLVAPTGGEEIVAVTSGLGLSGQYTVQADIWVNANGPFPAGGGGSTEFAGVGVSHDGTTVGRNGSALLYDGEGGSGSDYRLYIGSTQQSALNNSDPINTAAFPGVAPPASQSQTGTPADGSGGFQWMTLFANVDTVADTATYSLTSDASGNTVTVGTVTGGLGGGEVALAYADIFSSVSDNAALSFGLFDNVLVNTVPEPSSILLLLGLGGCALIRRRF